MFGNILLTRKMVQLVSTSYATTNSIYGTYNLRRHVFQQCKKNPQRHVDKKQQNNCFVFICISIF